MSEKAKYSLDFQSFISNRADASELSESRYNLLIGLMLAWGFGVNFVLVKVFQPMILNSLYAGGGTGWMLFLIAYFVLVIAGSNLVRSYSPGKCFLGYNMIALPIGVLVCMATAAYDPDLVIRAALCTAIVALVMMIAATVHPAFFQRMAGGLSAALLSVVLVEGLGMLLFPGVFTFTDWIVVVIMCLYIGFDWVRANTVQRTATNAIAAASALYLDIINIFLRLLRIFARSNRRD